VAHKTVIVMEIVLVAM